jgi:hypothetical protein
MEHQFLDLIIVPLALQPKCELTPNKHSMYIRCLWHGFKIYLKLFLANNNKTAHNSITDKAREKISTYLES